ncbi:bifunctional hydroxymethylpyrimidine kinase/phosphomethylpyrimidine kinase, partial [Staphylococcus aureus]|uniref:bifunctional hydroxymethylpyrimidine kinase/phosphomethylpyrimidine kinase n=1 Tax=Staphylococcus aureus TaxID=1280 RepID=UPI003F74CC53
MRPACIIFSSLSIASPDISSDAGKSGLIRPAHTKATIPHSLTHHQSTLVQIHPLLFATRAASSLDTDTKQNLQHTLLPLAYVVTPNLPESEEITGLAIDSEEKIM